MPRFKPIRPVRVSDEVFEQLKQSILLGQFKAGERLPAERDLAEEFQVSRVAVREALRNLENTGFISTRQGATGGAFVTDLTFDHLARSFLDLFLAEKISIPELYQVRLLVEPEMARLAAAHVTPEYTRRLRAALEAEGAPSRSLDEDVERKTAVHFILAEMCGNRFFEALVRSLMELTHRVVEAGDPDFHFIHPAGMHRPVVEAVLAGNPRKAHLAMKRHAMEFGKILMEREKNFRQKRSALEISTRPAPNKKGRPR
jgi:GntR family transcriptional regulator, transcriptional repressor for pyruvate dehydrogenase complex